MVSARALEVCLRFGVPMTGPSLSGPILHRLGLRFEPGSVALVAGPSGAGKTRLLAEIARQTPGSRLVQDALFPLDVPVIDAVLPTRPIDEAMALLTACGLGEPALWLRRFDQLSEGERFRARLARAMGLHRREHSRAPLLCDEFGSLLHQPLARAIAFNLRKLVTREKLALVVASCRPDLAEALRPDHVVRLPLGGAPAEAQEGNAGNQTMPPDTDEESGPGKDFARLIGPGAALRIERGTLHDYAALAGMHYRQREQLGFVDRIFVLRERPHGLVLGVVVYGHPSLELSLRNRVTGGRWIRQAEKLNRELRVLKRLVIHPDLRGCGVGHWLVRQTLEMAGTLFVECLAAMGAVNPVFEKAGMVRVGMCRAPAGWAAVVDELRAAGADPFMSDFVAQVCRRPAVRRLVARSVFNWYRATTSAGRGRVARQTPSTLARTFRQLAGSQPVYFIWSRDASGWAVIGRGLREMGLREPTEAGRIAAQDSLAGDAGPAPLNTGARGVEVAEQNGERMVGGIKI